MSRVSTFAVPSSSKPSSVANSFASKSFTLPLKVEIPRCPTSNVALEWIRSELQVPEGI